jgi:hypothetical protein
MFAPYLRNTRQQARRYGGLRPYWQIRQHDACHRKYGCQE